MKDTKTTKTTKKTKTTKITKTNIEQPVISQEYYEQTVSALRDIIQDKTNEVNCMARDYDEIKNEVDRVDKWCWFWAIMFVGSVIINIAW
jgi:hypothetical protein